MLTDTERLARVRRRWNIAWSRWIQAKISNDQTAKELRWSLLLGWNIALKACETAESIMDTKKHPPKLPTLPKNSIAHKDPSLTDMCLLVQVLLAVK